MITHADRDATVVRINLFESMPNVLFERVKTALILAVVFVIISTQSSVLVFSLVISGSIVFIAWEWATLAGFVSKYSKFVFTSCFIFVVSFLYLKLGLTARVTQINEELAVSILVTGVFFWIISIFFLYHYPKYCYVWNGRYKLSIVGLLTIIPAWNGMIMLKYFNPNGYLLLFIVILVAAADVGAYFIGKHFGYRKLAERLSPNKTLEGVFGGSAACMLSAIILVPLVNCLIPAADQISLFLIMVLILPVIIFSVVGDLLESMLKRNQGLKDSGNILPGHGGILDRIDGLLAVVPCFSLILFIITR